MVGFYSCDKTMPTKECTCLGDDDNNVFCSEQLLKKYMKENYMWVIYIEWSVEYSGFYRKKCTNYRVINNCNRHV